MPRRHLRAPSEVGREADPVAKNKKARTGDYSRETVLRKRKFPRSSVVIITLLALVQVAAILFICLFRPSPRDVINEYTVTVEPQINGTLDITYELVWTPMDKSEPLSWVEIGMANEFFEILEYSDTVYRVVRYEDPEYEGYVSARIYLDRAYNAGETVSFSFKVNQGKILSENGSGYLYEFVPGWFNEIPVEHCKIRWADTPSPSAIGADTYEFGYYVISRTLEPGDYVKVNATYPEDAFLYPSVQRYEPFDDSGAFNDLAGTQAGAIVIACIVILVCIIAEIYIIDGFVSYHRGRGFLRGYGYHVHVYGGVNPHYRAASAAHSSRGGGGGGGGCACACACACAGGGRAGCSEKDTFSSLESAHRVKSFDDSDR